MVHGAMMNFRLTGDVSGRCHDVATTIVVASSCHDSTLLLEQSSTVGRVFHGVSGVYDPPLLVRYLRPYQKTQPTPCRRLTYSWPLQGKFIVTKIQNSSAAIGLVANMLVARKHRAGGPGWVLEKHC
jgi:hypothetical protein